MEDLESPYPPTSDQTLPPQQEGKPEIPQEGEGNNEKKPVDISEERLRRRNTGDQKVENIFRVMRQSFIEAIGPKNWKTLSGETAQITHSPEMEAALKRLAALHHLYTEMEKVLTQHLNALKALSQSTELVNKFFNEAGVHEEDPSLREEFTSFAAQEKHSAKVLGELSHAFSLFSEHTNTFATKAIEDCFATSKKYNHARLEYDGYQTKLSSLEQDVATKGNSPKLEKEIALAKDQLQEASVPHTELSNQLLSKVELLMELKVKNLKEQILHTKKAMEQYLNDSMRAFEVPDHDN